jgi:hypothetical protein
MLGGLRGPNVAEREREYVDAEEHMTPPPRSGASLNIPRDKLIAAIVILAVGLFILIANVTSDGGHYG